MKILKKRCPYCEKEVTSLYQKQLDYNYEQHIKNCKEIKGVDLNK